jgi:hypothetical protein
MERGYCLDRCSRTPQSGRSADLICTKGCALTEPRKLGFEKQFFGADEQVRHGGQNDFSPYISPLHDQNRDDASRGSERSGSCLKTPAQENVIRGNPLRYALGRKETSRPSLATSHDRSAQPSSPSESKSLPGIEENAFTAVVGALSHPAGSLWARRISFAWRSSRFSRSKAFSFSAVSVRNPRLLPPPSSPTPEESAPCSRS